MPKKHISGHPATRPQRRPVGPSDHQAPGGPQRFQLTVWPEDGPPFDVTAGQREMSAWEREPFGCSSGDAIKDKPILFFRYLAYAALRRQGLVSVDENGVPVDFATWDDGIEEVTDADKGEPDPTETDQSLEG